MKEDIEHLQLINEIEKAKQDEIKHTVEDTKNPEVKEEAKKMATDFRKKIFNRIAAINPNRQKASNEIASFCSAANYRTIWDVKQGISDILNKYGFDSLEFDNWDVQLYAANPMLGIDVERATASKVFQVGERAYLRVSIYRKDNGSYEVTAYIS